MKAYFSDDYIISTHTPLARRDIYSSCAALAKYLFLLTRLSRGVTVNEGGVDEKKLFLLTRLSRGVTVSSDFRRNSIQISTHTPLARRDFIAEQNKRSGKHFYSHASREA